MFKLTKGIISLKIEVLSLNNNTLYKTQKGKKNYMSWDNNSYCLKKIM